MASPHSIIPIIICVIVTLFVVLVVSSPCLKPKDNVHYYVTKNRNHTELYRNHTELWLGKPEWNRRLGVWYAGAKHAISVCHDYNFEDYKLNLGDYLDMKNGEIREVFINLED